METLPELHPAIPQRGVLVVDDSALQRQHAIGLLRDIGVSRIFEAGDGFDALQLLRGLCEPPAIVVLDLEMPGMDGIEMAQHLALEGLCPNVLVVSGADAAILDVVQTMLEALGLPLLGALRKPLGFDAVVSAVGRFREVSPGGAGARREEAAGFSVDALRQAIHGGRILPFYQPKVWLENGQVNSLEALARWREKSGRLIPPAEFIPFAEEHGLIAEITLVMLDAVLRDLTAWNQNGFYPTVAINVAAPSLADRRFANEIIGRAEAARISPSALVLEITESALVGDMAATLGTLGRLRLRGFGLSIDDYGTGFSSMQQLSRLPFTELKADRTFVNHAHTKWQSRTILESAIGMGHRLGLTTVAEGIETQAELDLLRSLGCMYAQGNLITPPMPASALLPWIKREESRLQAMCAEA